MFLEERLRELQQALLKHVEERVRIISNLSTEHKHAVTEWFQELDDLEIRISEVKLLIERSKQ